MNTRAILIRCSLIYITLLSIALIPFNVARGLEYRNLIPGTNCQVLEVKSCEIVLGDDSYYNCDLVINCHNTKMQIVDMHLPIIPIKNGTVYNPYDDNTIRQYKKDFIAFNTILSIILIPLVFMPLIVKIVCLVDFWNNKNTRNYELDNDDVMLIYE